jgi:hypothetical protein
MSFYQAKAAVDPLERQRIETERRRERNIERAKRILQPKTRIMGVDVGFLDKQVLEKQEAERFELERNVFYDDMAVRNAKIASEEYNKKTLEKRREAEELEFARVQQHRDKVARNRAIELAKKAPEPETTFLKFPGEDLGFKDRKKLQQLQMKDWLSQQIDILREKEFKTAQEQADYDAMTLRVVELKGKLELDQAKTRSLEMKQAQLVNQQLASEVRSRNLALKQAQKKAEESELNHTLTSDFLTETVHPRVLGGARACSDNLPYHFKGFSTEQRQYVLDVQQRQVDEVQARRQADKEEEDRYNATQEQIRREMLLAEREHVRSKAQERQALSETRSLQKKDATLRANYLNNVVYQNPVQEEFFQQFGTSCR